MNRVAKITRWVKQETLLRRDKLINLSRLASLTKEVEEAASQVAEDAGTVVVFNASTRLSNLSLNAAFSLLSSWGLRLSGWRVINFVCQGGMSRCLQGSSENHPYMQPPCAICAGYSHQLYAGAEVSGFEYKRDEDLSAVLDGKSVADMSELVFEDLPLGELVLPSIRWRMRRHHLEDDQATLLLFREFILSAYHVGKEFKLLADREQPDLVLIFNGQMFPEAMVGYLARQRGIKVISHETGYQPFTAFMTSYTEILPPCCRTCRHPASRLPAGCCTWGTAKSHWAAAKPSICGRAGLSGITWPSGTSLPAFLKCRPTFPANTSRWTWFPAWEPRTCGEDTATTRY